jgi:hypothetical protein
MLKLLIGPVLTGAGWLAGSYYGSDARHLVNKRPNSTYEGLAQAIDGMPQGGTTSFEGGKPVPYEIKVERSYGKRLYIRIMFDGREGANTEVVLAPQEDGKATLLTAKAHGDREVLRAVLAGSSSARLAYAPDWMLNILSVRPLLQQLGEQIEKGQPVSMGFQSPADWEASLSADKQRQMQEWRQYDAARPRVDPNGDAQRYLKPQYARQAW